MKTLPRLRLPQPALRERGVTTNGRRDFGAFYGTVNGHHFHLQCKEGWKGDQATTIGHRRFYQHGKAVFPTFAANSQT